MLRIPRRFLALGLAGLLAGCAGTTRAERFRPSLAPGSGAGYREFAAGQEREIREGPHDEAERRLAERVDLPALLSLAFARSPRIRRARRAWRAAIERVPQAVSLPDPTLSMLTFTRSVETRVGPQEQVFTFAQKIPFPAKLLLQGDVAAEEARIAGLAYSAVVRDVLVEVKVAYAEYVYLTRAREIVRQNEAIARRLAGLGEDLYSEDRALLIDVLKAQSQLAQLRYDLVTLGELVSAETTRINTLLDRPPEAPLGSPAPLPFPRVVVPVTDLYELAAKNREELAIADRRIEEARAREDLARSRYAPDLTLGAVWVRVDGNRPPRPRPPDNGKDAVGFTVGVTIPLWVNRISAGVREARARREAAVAGKVDAWNRTFAGIKDAYFRLTNAERLVLLYRDNLIPQAEQAMLSTEERAREDRKRLGDYLEAQIVWLNFTLARERALADLNQAVARIERLTGAALVPAKAGGDR